MEDSLLTTLLNTTNPDALQALAQTYSFDIATLQELKELSARFYFTDPEKSKRIAEAAYRLGQLLPDPAPALGQWTLANALMYVDRFKEAADLFQQACTAYKEAALFLDAARAGVGYIWMLANLGEFDAALELAAECEQVLTASKDDPEDYRRLGGVFNNKGIVYELMGRYEESLEAYDRKLEISRDLDRPLDAARAQNNRGLVLMYLNAFEEGLNAFHEAEQVFLIHKALPDLARVTYNIGTLYALWGRYTEADRAFAKAESWLAESGDDAQARAVLNLYRGLSQLASKRPIDTQVVKRLSTAQAALEIHGPLFEEGLAWIGLGYCDLKSNALEAAQRSFEQALAIAERGGGQVLGWEALHGLGTLAEAQDNPEAAAAFYQQAIGKIEATREELCSTAFRATFLTNKLDVYQDLILLHIKEGALAEAFAVVERAKSRLLAERLGTRLRDEVTSLEATDTPEAALLTQRLKATLKQLSMLYRQAHLEESQERGGSWSAAPTPDTACELKRLEETAAELMKQLEHEYPLLSPLTTGKTASLQTLQARLHRTVFLEYYVARGHVELLVITHAGIEACCDLGPLGEVQEAGHQLFAAIERTLGLAATYGPQTLNRYLPSLITDTNTHLAALYDLLIRPLAVHLTPGCSLVISPDGPLHSIPFHALFDGERYLVEDYVVSYTPSATVLLLCQQRTAAGEGMLAIGYGGERLQQVAAETQEIADLFPKALRLSEHEARVDAFLAAAPAYRILHIAAHAHFRDDCPMLSAFSLADRQLTLAEISHLKIEAELVTLSGCATGRGPLQGADLISLASGFLGAGARALLVSLWEIDDRTTAQFMKSFYRGRQTLREPSSLAAQNGTDAWALRQAQLELLELGRTHADVKICSHPAYWAPFILLGDNSTPPDTNEPM